MDYIKVRLGRNLEEMHSRLSRTIDEMFRRVNPMLVMPEQAWRPQMDVYETENEIVLLAELSGVDKDDLEVELDQNVVRISGRRKEIPRGRGIRYHLAEIAYGSFERILRLPAAIDTEGVTASYANGVLKVTISKKQRDTVRRIQVEGA